MKPSAYGPFPYSPIIKRPRFILPDGNRIALWVIPNLEVFGLNEPIPSGGRPGPAPPDVPSWSVRDYGNRIGVFRLMEVLDRYSIRATAALNSDLCAAHPEIISEAVARRWEFMGHNESNARRLTTAPPGQEPVLIRNTLGAIARGSGVRPRGWLSSGLAETWDTLDYLVAEGVDYVCDWINDDQPYAMTLDSGRSIISVPYSEDLNDKPQFEKRNRTPEEFESMICREFDVLYRESEKGARVIAIAVHPYIIGAAHRIGALDSALEYICRHQGVWRATGGEICDHYRKVSAATA
jgi:peptidoglycan/xylan/chitin deacetylase (PgdA/CDA1 family)